MPSFYLFQYTTKPLQPHSTERHNPMMMLRRRLLLLPHLRPPRLSPPPAPVSVTLSSQISNRHRHSSSLPSSSSSPSSFSTTTTTTSRLLFPHYHHRHFSSSSSPTGSPAEVLKTLVQDLGNATATSDAEQAVAVVHKFPHMPAEATMVVYNVAIGTCVRAGKMEEAVGLLNELFANDKMHVAPNHLTYQLLVFGAARAGDWAQAQTFRDEMLQAKLRPDAHVYHGLLLACGKAKETKMVGELLSQMDGPKLLPTYTTAIAAYARCGDWKAALELLKHMKEEDGLEPSPEAYHAAMFACTKGEPLAKWTECLDLLREVQASKATSADGTTPVNATSYNTAILCAGMAHETEAVYRLLEEMKEKAKIEPNNGSYRGLIKSLTKSGDYEKCLSILDDMTKKGLEPDLLLFTDAMEVFAKSQNPGATLRVLDQMKKAKQPDLRLYLGPLIDADEAAERPVHEAFVKEVEKLGALQVVE